MQRVRTLVLNAALGALDYRVPESMAVEPGSVVVAPLGPRQILGVVWEPAAGFVRVEDSSNPRRFSGAVLHALASGSFASAAARSQAKYLTRAILAHHLDGVVLNTRQILIDLHKL